MAPITLQPDDSDTGWVIAGTVEFQGILQYVVTPTDNPAHRRPVKKQHILDWVSAKAHEDFEYAQYNRQIDEEREREHLILAKAAATRKRRRRMGLARERAKARKPFARYMQLEQVEDSERGNTSGHLSSPEHSPDESNGDVLPGRVQSIKRKRSVGILQDNEPSLEHRGRSTSRKPSLIWKPWKLPPVKPSQQCQVETTEDENDKEDEAEGAPNIFSAELKSLDTPNRPILPPPRQFSTPPRTSMPQKSSVSPHSAHATFIPATTSPSRVSPKFHWSVLGRPIRDSVITTKSASPPDHSIATSPRKVTPGQPPNNGKVYPRILPPMRLSRLPVSKPLPTTPHVTLNGTGGSSKRGRPKRKRHSLSPTDESTATAEGSEARSRSNSGKPELPNEKNVMGRSHISDLSTSRGRQVSHNDEVPKQKKDNGSRSRSSGSSNVLRWPSHRQSPKLSNEQSKYFASMKMKQNSKEDNEHNVEGETEETWDIHGILDDEMRRVDGHLVCHYLCEWVGGYDPTWEPEGNISTDALKRYEKKKRRDRPWFDGAANMDMMSENDEASNPKTLRRFDDIVGQKSETNDSEAFTDAPADAAMFLTPNENPRSRSEAGNTAGDGIVVGAVLL
jgi:hypothetical protein